MQTHDELNLLTNANFTTRNTFMANISRGPHGDMDQNTVANNNHITTSIPYKKTSTA